MAVPTVSQSPSSVGATDVASERGKTIINDNVVAKVAGIAAREITGVHDLGGGAARAIGAIRDAISSTDLTQGISVEVGERQAAVDVTIVAEYPVPLQEVAAHVRAAVIGAVESLVGLEVTEVNVTVNDVHVPSADNGSESVVRAQ